MKIQFNATSLKNFRNTMAKYYNARHTLADFILKNNVIVSGLQASLAEDTAQFERLLKGESDGITRSIDEINASINAVKQSLETRKNALADATTRMNTACTKAIALVTDELYTAYVDYVSAKGNASADDYALAIATWLQGVGASDATAENCLGYVGLTGLADNGSRKAFKSGNLTDAKSRKAFEKCFLGALSDRLVDDKVIDPYKYTFVPTKK